MNSRAFIIDEALFAEWDIHNFVPVPYLYLVKLAYIYIVKA